MSICLPLVLVTLNQSPCKSPCCFQEDQERFALEQRLAQMLPTIAWMNPAENDAMSKAELASMPAPPARGEDSIEAAEAAARRQQVSIVSTVQTATQLIRALQFRKLILIGVAGAGCVICTAISTSRLSSGTQRNCRSWPGAASCHHCPHSTVTRGCSWHAAAAAAAAGTSAGRFINGTAFWPRSAAAGTPSARIRRAHCSCSARYRCCSCPAGSQWHLGCRCRQCSREQRIAAAAAIGHASPPAHLATRTAARRRPRSRLASAQSQLACWRW